MLNWDNPLAGTTKSVDAPATPLPGTAAGSTGLHRDQDPQKFDESLATEDASLIVNPAPDYYQ